jgi:hypothetical protein
MYSSVLPNIKMDKFDPSRTTMQAWLERLLIYFNMLKVPQSDWVSHLLWLLDDVNTSTISRMPKRMIDDHVMESSLQHFERCTEQLLQMAGTSAAEMKALHNQLQSIHRSADETLSEFWSRYMSIWTALWRDTSHSFDRNDYNQLIRALGPDVVRASLAWEWCEPDEAPRVFGAVVISDRSTLYGRVSLFEASRSPTEEHDAFCRNIAAQLAREASFHSHRSPFAVNLEARMATSNGAGNPNGNGRKGSPPSVDGINPALKPETLQLYEAARKNGTLTRYAGPAHTPAAPPAPPAFVPRNQQQQSSGQKRGAQAPPSKQPPATQRGPARSTTPFPAAKKARVAGGNLKKEGSSDDADSGSSDSDICPGCALHHSWDQCPRNKLSTKYQAYLEKYVGQGHPKATEADCNSVGLRFVGDRAAAADSTAPMDSSSSSAPPPPPAPATRRARIVQQQQPASKEPKSILKKTTMTRLLQGPAGDLEVVIPGYLEDVAVEAFVLDTGAQVCLVSEDFYKTHRAHFPALGPVPAEPVELADGFHAKILGSFELRLSVLNHETQQLHEIKHPFIVVADLSTPVLLGLDACRRLFYKLNFQTGRPEFESPALTAGHRVNLISAPGVELSTPLRMVSSISLAPGYTRLVSCTYDPEPFHGEAAVLVRPVPFLDSNEEELPEVFVPHIRDADLPRARRYWVQLLNTSSFHLSFPSGLVVGRVYALPGGQLEAVKAAPEGEYRMNRQGELQSTARPEVRASPPAPSSSSPASAPAAAAADPPGPRSTACRL